MSAHINPSTVCFTKREIYFYNMIDKFYRHCDKKYILKMIDIINGDAMISLRILDWFVTRYSNKKKILLTAEDTIIDVHISYKAQLKSYKKKYFDPFKRREKFEYHFKEVDKTIYTTIGQLNFFRWAIEINIINYIENNYDTVAREMNISNKDDKKRKKNKSIEQTIGKIINPINKKNTIYMPKNMLDEHMKIIITFD